ncbi:MAG: orotate phosphoribosyltransferase [Rubricoccaceae bacterium]
MPDALATAIARDLLALRAVVLRPNEPFTWASGRLSPVYTDNRLTLGDPEVRDRLADGFRQLAEAFDATLIAGTATAGIPHGTLLADRLNLPLVYVRSKPKGHGRKNLIEGAPVAGHRVLVVEDLVSTGGSVLAAAEALRESGATPVAALAVFSYGLVAATDAFQDADLPLRTLTSLDALLTIAEEEGTLDSEALTQLRDWRRDPAAWSEERGGNG